MDQKPLVIRLHNRYVTRNGLLAEVTEFHDGEIFPWSGRVEGNMSQISWNLLGGHVRRGAHPLDLVRPADRPMIDLVEVDDMEFMIIGTAHELIDIGQTVAVNLETGTVIRARATPSTTRYLNQYSDGSESIHHSRKKADAECEPKKTRIGCFKISVKTVEEKSK